MVGIVALAALVLVVTSANRTIRQKSTEAERERDQARDVTEFLVSSFRKPDPAQDGRQQLQVAEVLSRAVTELGGHQQMAPSTRATILSAVGQTYRGLGLVPENLEVSEKAFAIRHEVLGEDHLDTLMSMNDVAVAYYDAGQFDRAIQLHEQALERGGRPSWGRIIPIRSPRSATSPRPTGVRTSSTTPSSSIKGARGTEGQAGCRSIPTRSPR